MKKAILLLILSIVVILAAMFFILDLNTVKAENKTVKVENKHFENSEISFDYPGNWNTVNMVKRTEIVYLTDHGNGSNFTVYKYPIPEDYNLEKSFESKTIGSRDTDNVQLVSKSKLNLNGKEAYETVYDININNGTLEQKNVIFAENGLLYSLVFTTPKSTNFPNSITNLPNNITNLPKSITNLPKSITDLPKSITNLWDTDKSSDIVIRSLKVNNSDNPVPTPAWGEVYIPKLGVNWWIRSDTLNAYNSVYHFPNSVLPGENGECGLTGHRTRFSAPFNKKDQLKAGDQVIIIDFKGLKKATYQVGSNMDIRWDYKTNPYIFEDNGKPRLDMLTCYPPGYSMAADWTHCKLIDVTPLN